MKKAFDANVSRAKPRVRLGAAFGEVLDTHDLAESVEAIAAAVANEPAPVIPDLSAAVRERVSAFQQPRPTAVEAVQQAISQTTVVTRQVAVEAPRAAYVEPRVVQQQVEAPRAPVTRDVATGAQRPMPRAHAEAPAPVVEVQHVPPPTEMEPIDDSIGRRERLKERLKAVRENPRPEPLPETVAEAGVLAVERISALQTELVKVRALNLALSQDLEATRRQAERATEEARLRMDEAKRISTEMEARVTLLTDLEKELAALEGERNESLMALQESRQALDAADRDKDVLRADIQKRDQALAESLSEEERLASELEMAHEAATNIRRSAEALRSERDMLARQVSDLTRERAELMEARKALEAVHRALAHAVSR